MCKKLQPKTYPHKIAKVHAKNFFIVDNKNKSRSFVNLFTNRRRVEKRFSLSTSNLLNYMAKKKKAAKKKVAKKKAAPKKKKATKKKKK